MEDDMRERIHALETAQAVQEATMAGAQATQAASQAGMSAAATAAQAGNIALIAGGSVALVVGMLLGRLFSRT